MHVGWIKQARIVNGPYWFLGVGLLALGMMGPAIGVIIAHNLSFDLPRWVYFIGVAVFPFALLCIILSFRQRRRTIAIIRANNGYVCISCGYPIDPKLDHAPCPECGTPINLAHCRKVWSRHLLGGW
jgi:predicted RNA-binding Zn-ribbon protein involved in translation (DUF1610 family)